MAKKKLTYEEMNDKQKAAHDKWMARSKAMESGGKTAMGLGCSMVILGLVLTVIVVVLLIVIL